jgi:3'(2'), 5'-bisphosphate nucleotidase
LPGPGRAARKGAKAQIFGQGWNHEYYEYHELLVLNCHHSFASKHTSLLQCQKKRNDGIEESTQSMQFTREYETISAAVRQAAQLTRLVRERLVVASDKGGGEPVTIADFGSQALICRALQSTFPADAVLAEERASDFIEQVAAEQQQQVLQFLGDILGQPVERDDLCAWLDHGRDTTTARKWIIDPIDGTKGFLAGRHYTLAVGLVIDSVPTFSVMGCPVYPHETGMGLLFFAERSGGAFCQPLDDAQAAAQEVRVSQMTAATESRGVESVEERHTDHAVLDRIREQMGASSRRVVRIDGQDKYAAVAAGDAEYYLRLSPRPDYRDKVWDHAAGMLLVQEAGGRVTDLHGKELDFSAGAKLAHNVGIIASNGALHEKLLAAVALVG